MFVTVRSCVVFFLMNISFREFNNLMKNIVNIYFLKLFVRSYRLYTLNVFSCTQHNTSFKIHTSFTLLIPKSPDKNKTLIFTPEKHIVTEQLFRQHVLDARTYPTQYIMRI